jgi:hypothetical protein
MLAGWRDHPQERFQGEYAALYNKAAIRGREVICLLGIFAEHARGQAVLSEYCLFLDRTIFTMFALAPVLRLGMPHEFGEFVRQSVLSIAVYFYSRAKIISGHFEELSPCYYDELLESLAELSKLMPRLRAFREEDDDYLGAA